MKIITILGTRPEIIKLSALIPLLEKEEGFEHIIIHTGQHYDYNMDKVFFEELNLPQPKYKFKVGSHPHGRQTALMLEKIEGILLQEKPDLVLVLGDTNTTLAGALAASKLHLKVMHIESGCRSFNRRMPEEINRIITDHISDYLIAPDENSYNNLITEGIQKEKIFLLGSTMFDAVARNKTFAEIKGRVCVMKSYGGLQKNYYILVTIHRAENTDDPAVLSEIISALNEIADEISKEGKGEAKVIFPIHPRTRKIIENNQIKRNDKIIFTRPESYLSFLALLSNCRFCITDSGGIQEEALTLNIPCLIPRNDTEWMRIVESGKNKLIGTKKEKIILSALELWKDDQKLEAMKAKESPFSPGASKRIVEVIRKIK